MILQERSSGSPTELNSVRPENSINYIRSRIQNKEAIPSNQQRIVFQGTSPNKEEICDILRLNKDEYETIYETASDNANLPCFVTGDASELYGENYKGIPIHIVLAQETLASSYDIRSTFPEIQRAIQEYNCSAVINDKPLLDELCGYIAEPAESSETKTSQSGGAWTIPEWAPQIEGGVDSEAAYIDHIAEKIVSSIEDYKSYNDYLIRYEVLTHVPPIDDNIKREERKTIVKSLVEHFLKISEKTKTDDTDKLFERYFFFYLKSKDKNEPLIKHTRIQQLIECLLFRKNYETDGNYINGINEINDANTINIINSVGSGQSSTLLKLMENIPNEIVSKQGFKLLNLKMRGIKIIQPQEIMERHKNLSIQTISYKQFAGDEKYREYNAQKFWAKGIINKMKTAKKDALKEAALNEDALRDAAINLFLNKSKEKYEQNVIEAAYTASDPKNNVTRMALIRTYYGGKTVEEDTIIEPELYTTSVDKELLLLTGIINIVNEILDSDQSMELYFTFMYLINKQPVSFYNLYDDMKYFNYSDGTSPGILIEELKKAYRTDLCYNMIVPVDENHVKITTSLIKGPSNQLLLATKAIFTSLFKKKVVQIDFGDKPEFKDQEQKDMTTKNLTVINWKYPQSNKIMTKSIGCGFIAKDDIKDESYGVYSNIQEIVDSKKRHNVMAVLSQLVYSTTEMIQHYFKRNTIVYLGSYDPDTIWYNESCKTQIKHRIHAFYEKVESNHFNLYIAFRGSHTGDDWHDIDKKIVEGTAVFFDKRVNAMNSILLKIQNDLADKLNINGNTKTTYTVDTYSCGHSLGGFLALMAAFKSLYGLMQKEVTRNSENFKLVFYKEKPTPKICEEKPTPKKNCEEKPTPKIIPVVFNPFCGTGENTMAIVSTIPKGFVYRIHAGKPDDVLSANDYASLGLQLYRKQMRLNFINMLNTCVFLQNDIAMNEEEEEFYTNSKYEDINYSKKIIYFGLDTYSHLMYNFIGKHALTMQLNEVKDVFENNYKLNSYIDYDSEKLKNIDENNIEDELSPPPAPVPAAAQPTSKAQRAAVAAAAIKRSSQGKRRITYRKNRKERMSYKANRN